MVMEAVMPRTLARLFVVGFLCLSALPTLAKPEHYDFDKPHTRITFYVSHSDFSNMMGEFRDYSGSFIIDEEKPEESSVEIAINLAGVDTRDDGLNKHLQTKDFFDSANFPTATFKSTRVERTGDKTAKLTGDLTLLGVTKPLTLDVTLNKIGIHPITKNTIAGFTADGVIKRSDFGMNYGLPDVIGDDVKLHIEAEGVNLDRLPGKKKHP